MKSFPVFILLFFIPLFCTAQNGLFIGYENGFLLDRFNYVNSKGYSLDQSGIGGTYGGFVGYRLNTYSLETGFYAHNSMHPFVDYDYATGKPSSSNSYGSGAQRFVIPLRVAKEFLLAQEKLVIRPEVALNVMILRDYTNSDPIGGWGENVSALPGDNSYTGQTPDSTRAWGYVPSHTNLSIETGLSVAYRFKKVADIYLKGSYLAGFKTMYYETITHYSATEVVQATSVNSNAFTLQVGLRYFFDRKV